MRELQQSGRVLSFPNRLEGRTPPRRESLVNATATYAGFMIGATIGYLEHVISSFDRQLPQNITPLSSRRSQHPR